MTEIRLPEINGTTTQEQLRQIRAYLMELAEQLQEAFDTPQKQAEADGTAQLVLRSREVVERLSGVVEKRLAERFPDAEQYDQLVQETRQSIEQTSRELRQEFGSILNLVNSLEGGQEALIQVTACIRTGLLYEDESGSPVYGVEIGQENTADGTVQFRRFVRLTANRLSFFDAAGNEVAAITDQLLHVTAANLTTLTAADLTASRLRLGNCTLTASPDGHLTF